MILLNTGLDAISFLAIVSLIPHDVLTVRKPALIVESSAGRLRYSGSSLGYLASVIAGGPAPL